MTQAEYLLLLASEECIKLQGLLNRATCFGITGKEDNDRATLGEQISESVGKLEVLSHKAGATLLPLEQYETFQRQADMYARSRLAHAEFVGKVKDE